jgi:putative acetyltransferase
MTSSSNVADNAELIVRSATNADRKRIEDLVFGVLAEYGLESDPEGTDSDLADIDGNYIANGGVFELIETRDGRLLGTAALFPVDEKTVELRKMYFEKELRGRGWGRRMLARLIDRSRELGFKRIYLETASVLTEATRLYEKFGFVQTDETHAARSDRGYLLEL